MASSVRNEKRKKNQKNANLLPNKEVRGKWSIKPILLISIFGAMLLIFVTISTSNYHISNFLKLTNKANYTTTNATVYYYEAKSLITQTEYGNSNEIISYLVKYKYRANEKTFHNEETLSINTKSDFIHYITNNLNTESFLVQYDISNPGNSFLIQK
jgi:hypothetical protein